MENKSLTGIERELVLQYLIDGNVPVTLTPIDSKEVSENINESSGEALEQNRKIELKSPDERIHSINSQVFPVAIKGENVKVSENGFIVLENPPQSVNNFTSKRVKVEFYFNRVGLYFESKVSSSKEGLSIEIPKEIDRIQDVEEEHLYDFSAVIYFDFRNKLDLNQNCVPWNVVELFERPVWKSIPLENQKTAKNYLERFVENAKIERNAGNGIQLIPVCNYLTYQNNKVGALENRTRPFDILYIDHERIVIGSDVTNQAFVINQNNEYGVKLIFSLKRGPVLSRDIFVTCIVNKIYLNEDSTKICADLCYTTIQEEDLRYIYERATKNLFN